MILPLIASIYGCAAPTKPCFKNGRDYSKTKYKIVTNDWDGCYLRGCSYLEGDCIDLAMAEFKKAIKDRSKDERLARPYGIRFMGYYPHRELGIIYYQMDRMEAAIEELERSIKDSPSSKASYFLNKARKAWLQKNDLDALPPQLDISFPPAPHHITNKSVLVVKGRAKDDQFVSSLSFDEESIFIELSARHIPLQHTIRLKRGLNKILVSAGDLTGKKVGKKLTIMVDRSAPLINLSYSLLEDALHKQNILLQGALFDESGISEFIINDQPVILSQKGKVCTFSHTISLSEVEKTISFFAIDKAGNKNTDFITLFSDSERRRHVNSWLKSKENEKQIEKTHRKQKKKNLIRIASLDILPIGAAESTTHFAPPKTAAVNETLLDESESSPDAFLLLSKPLPQETIYNEIYLNGKIYYKKDIVSIKIIVYHIVDKREIKNEIQYDSAILHTLKNCTKQKNVLLLNEIIELEKGKNKIITEITDGEGKTKRDIHYITKKEEKLQKWLRQFRLCVYVPPVKDLSPNHFYSPPISVMATETLRSAFINQQRFLYNPRDQEKMGIILKELNYNTTEVFDKRIALKPGKMRPVDMHINGTIYSKDQEFIELTGVITDVELGTDPYSEDICLGIIDPNNIYTTISKAAEILAMKIRAIFPLCKGKVIEKKGLKIFVDFGQQCCNSPEGNKYKHKINEDTKLIVYREDKYGENFRVARIERVYDESSRAVLSSQNNSFNKIKNALRKITSFIAPISQINAYDSSLGTGELEVEIGNLVITK